MPRPVRVTYHIAPTSAAVAQAAAELFTRSAADAVAARGKARLAISGGSTPKAMFALLADPAQPFLSQVPWNALNLFWVDERCVPPDDPESNYRMTRDAMLSKVPLAPEHIHRMEGELDPEVAASRYESVLRNTFKLEGAETPTFDLILLGMGDDGHTASLFPHTAALDEMARLVVANHVPQKDTWRITLTWPVINQGREVAFLIEGAAKTQVLHDVLLGLYDPETKPSQLIRPASGKLTLLLDPVAAAKLPQPVDSADGAGRDRNSGASLMILAGDVGGTKVHLSLYEFAGGRLKPLRSQKYPAHQFGSLDDVIKQFLGASDIGQQPIAAACFGCPGPVREGRLKLTNLPWTLDAHELSISLGIQHIFLINDLEANGYGIPELLPEQVFTLHAGDMDAVGHRGLIAAGTGLGEAVLIWDGNRHTPIPSEGGHCDFAARTDREIALLQHLRRTLNGRVSFERVVSGLGIKNVYAYLRDVEKLDEPHWLRDRLAAEDPNAVIGQCAEDGSSSICFETMRLFSAAYGAEAGNIALKVLAIGGIYLGGGIAPKILKTLQNGAFIQAFLDKGRLSPLLQSIPVRVILDDTCALLGAAAYAEARASELSGHSERVASTAV